MKAEAPSPQTTLVILLGASEWPYAPDFHDSEAFANSARDFRRYILDPYTFNLAMENLLDLFNSNLSSDDIDREMGQFLDKRISEMKASDNPARDVVAYFVGHGGFAGNDLDYYLAIRRTRMENPIASSLGIKTLSHTLKDKARYLRRIIILDCCFAASASVFFQSEPAQAAMIQTIDAFKVPEKGIGLPGRGTSLLCSSRHNIPSLISRDGRYTMFSEALLRALNNGNPGQQGYLTLRTAARLTEDFLRDEPGDKAPRPEVHSPDQSEGDVADVPLFPNPAGSPVKVSKNRDILPGQEVSEGNGHRMPTDHGISKAPSQDISRRRLILGALSVLGVGALSVLGGSALIRVIARPRDTRVQNLNTKCFTSSTIYTGHTNAVWCVAWSPDSLSIASGGADHTVQVWYALNGRNIHTYMGHQPESVRSVAWSPDSKRIASGGDDKTVQIWSAIDGKHFFTYHEHKDGVRSVAWSPESTRIVSAGRDLIVRVWNAIDGSPVSTFRGHTDVVLAVAWSPNGAYIASAGLDKTVQVWEANTGNPAYTYRGHRDVVTAVAWANNSMLIASASVDKTVQAWDALTDNHTCTYPDHTGRVLGVTWSPVAKYIASAGEDKIVRVWRLQ